MRIVNKKTASVEERRYGLLLIDSKSWYFYYMLQPLNYYKLVFVKKSKLLFWYLYVK